MFDEADEDLVPVSLLQDYPGDRDQYGDRVDTGEFSSSLLPPAFFAPGAMSSELAPGVDAIECDAVLYWPDITDLSVMPMDRIEVMGSMWQVVGEPAVWPLGTTLALKKVRGKHY